jgi:nucleotide-binding universal stress UspA family protein
MARTHTIVLGYDGTESARRALERAASLVNYGSRLLLVHVAGHTGELSLSRALLDDAERTLMTDHRVFCERRELVGKPATELMKLATEVGADFIVIGNGKTTLQRLLSGSVSTEIVHHAPCDVLVVR